MWFTQTQDFLFKVQNKSTRVGLKRTETFNFLTELLLWHTCRDTVFIVYNNHAPSNH